MLIIVRGFCEPWGFEMGIEYLESVEIAKLDHTGEPVMQYPGVPLVYCSDHCAVRCRWEHETRTDLGPFAIQRNDILIEYYYWAKWFNILAVYGVEGWLRGWYCNVARPAEFLDGVIRWQDLALDLLVVPSGQVFVDDEDEFDALSLTENDRARALEALRTLEHWVGERRSPFLISTV